MSILSLAKNPYWWYLLSWLKIKFCILSTVFVASWFSSVIFLVFQSHSSQPLGSVLNFCWFWINHLIVLALSIEIASLYFPEITHIHLLQDKVKKRFLYMIWGRINCSVCIAKIRGIHDFTFKKYSIITFRRPTIWTSSFKLRLKIFLQFYLFDLFKSP